MLQQCARHGRRITGADQLVHQARLDRVLLARTQPGQRVEALLDHVLERRDLDRPRDRRSAQHDRRRRAVRLRDVVDLDARRRGWIVELRGVSGAVRSGGWAVRDRNAPVKYRRRLPDTPLTRRAGMRDRFQFLPHVDEH